jgi:hypothetical protein
LSYYNDDAKKIKKYASSDNINKSKSKYLIPISVVSVLIVATGVAFLNIFNNDKSENSISMETSIDSVNESTTSYANDSIDKDSANDKQNYDSAESTNVSNNSLFQDEKDNNQEIDIIDFSNHSYQIIDNSSITSFQEADEYCRSIGGHLATIQSQEENDYLYSLIISKGYESAYFGLTDKDIEGTWKWTNGESVKYTNWASNEPNSENSEENYAMFYYKYTDGKWNDGRWGDSTVAFICEWDDSLAIQGDEKNHDSQLSESIDFSNHSYQVIEDSEISSFEEADEYCKSIGGHLATIQSQEENDYLYSLIISKGYESAYFGLTDKDIEGTWNWTNGEPVNYTNWASNEPNSENSEENYAMFYYKYTDGKWNDGRWGDNTVAFICEWDDQ